MSVWLRWNESVFQCQELQLTVDWGSNEGTVTNSFGPKLSWTKGISILIWKLRRIFNQNFFHAKDPNIWSPKKIIPLLKSDIEWDMDTRTPAVNLEQVNHEKLAILTYQGSVVRNVIQPLKFFCFHNWRPKTLIKKMPATFTNK